MLRKQSFIKKCSCLICFRFLNTCCSRDLFRLIYKRASFAVSWFRLCIGSLRHTNSTLRKMHESTKHRTERSKCELWFWDKNLLSVWSMKANESDEFWHELFLSKYSCFHLFIHRVFRAWVHYDRSNHCIGRDYINTIVRGWRQKKTLFWQLFNMKYSLLRMSQSVPMTLFTDRPWKKWTNSCWRLTCTGDEVLK